MEILWASASGISEPFGPVPTLSPFLRRGPGDGPPLSTVLDRTTLNTRRFLEKDVPVRTPNVYSVSRAAAQGS